MLNASVTWARAKVPAVLAVIWEWLTWGIAKVKASIVALMSSPAVWLACGVVFVGGFMAGHGSRATTIKRLTDEKAAIAQARDASRAQDRELRRTIANLRKELQEAKDAVPSSPAPEAAPAPKRAPAVKKPRLASKPAAPVAAVPFRNPFGG